jgi:hypothetical protein
MFERTPPVPLSLRKVQVPAAKAQPIKTFAALDRATQPQLPLVAAE